MDDDRRDLDCRQTGCILRSSGMPRLTYSKREAIRQAVAMQRYCVEGAELLGRDLAATDNKEQRARIATGLGNLVKAWRVAEDAKRVLKGEPLPGSYKAEKPKQDRNRGIPTVEPE